MCVCVCVCVKMMMMMLMMTFCSQGLDLNNFLKINLSKWHTKTLNKRIQKNKRDRQPDRQTEYGVSLTSLLDNRGNKSFLM